MEHINCATCLKPKAYLNCGICHQPICKGCTQFLEENTFSFLPRVPKDLSHTVYCGLCFDEKVQPNLVIYNQTMETAKNILVFDKTQGKETRLFCRKEPLMKINDCKDQNELLLRFAFFAAQAQFNAIIDVDITARKIREGTYQYSLWSGTARPTQLKKTYQ